MRSLELPPTGRGGALLLVLVVLLASSGRVCLATECDPGICSGNPCTITGDHVLTSGCVLDFGVKHVTLVAGSSITAPEGASIEVRAGKLTVRGLIEVPSGRVSIDVAGDFRTEGGTTGRLKVDGTFATLEVTAGGAVTLQGSLLSANGWFGVITISAATITAEVGTEISADGGLGGPGEISLEANGGPITNRGQLHAMSVLVDEGGGEVALSATGTVTIAGPVNVSAPAGGSAGGITVQAGGDLVISEAIHADGSFGGDGGAIALLASGDVSIDEVVTANGSGFGGSGGVLTIRSGPDGTITINRALEATTTDLGSSDGEIDIGPACQMIVAALLKTRGPVGGGRITLRYREALDLSAGSMLSDPEGGNQLVCRCLDSDRNGSCDGGCLVNPTGLRPAYLDPPVEILPQALGPCLGCSNGVVEPSLGEQCDDGNFNDLDECPNNCRLTDCDDVPKTGCASPLQPGKSTILLKHAAGGTRDLLAWSWRLGPATSLADLGDPRTTTDYALCIYHQPGAQARRTLDATIPAGAVCAGKPCWKALGTAGYRYADAKLTRRGLRSVKLKAGAAGKPSIVVAARGPTLALPALPLALPVTVQLKSSQGGCWEARFSQFQVNQATQFKARSD